MIPPLLPWGLVPKALVGRSFWSSTLNCCQQLRARGYVRIFVLRRGKRPQNCGAGKFRAPLRGPCLGRL